MMGGLGQSGLFGGLWRAADHNDAIVVGLFIIFLKCCRSWLKKQGRQKHCWDFWKQLISLN